jgi:hypothetical protein
LRDAVLEVDGWRHLRGELVIRCRTMDGARALLPAAWTDLPRTSAVESSLRLVATAQGWRRFADVASGVRGGREAASKTVEVTMSGQLALAISEARTAPAVIWETLPMAARTQVTIVLLNQVRAGRRDAIHITRGKRRGLRIQLHPGEQGLLDARPAQADHDGAR